MLFIHFCIFLILQLNKVSSKSFLGCNTSVPLSKIIENSSNTCELSSFPRHAIQATRDLVCYIDTKIINFYYTLDTKSLNVEILLKEIHRCTSAPIQTFTYHGNESFTGLNEIDPTLHVLTFPNTTSEVIHRSLMKLEKFSANKKHQKYLVIVEEITNSNVFETWLPEIFHLVWQKNVLNVLVIFYLDKKVQIYTYNPFDPSNYFIKIQPRQFQDVYYRNLGNLHKHPVYVSMYVDGVRSFGKDEHGFDGVDGNVAELLEEKLNATFIYLEGEENSTNTVFLGMASNNSLINDVVDVVNERANLSMNSRWLYEREMIENTNSYEQNNLCVIVPKAKQIPSFYNLFYTMKAETWIASILFIIIVTLVYFVVQISNKQVDRRNSEELELNLIDIWFYMLQSFFGDSLTRLPQSASLRLIIITWLSYSLIISSAFTGTLISKIAIPLYENDLESITELRDSGMDILILDYVYQTRHIWDASLFETLNGQFRSMNSSQYDRYLNINTTGMAFALGDSRADFEMARRGDNKAGRPFYHKMQDCLIYFPRGYIATIGSPYIGMINDILGILFEAGFNKHWEEMAQFKARIKGIISESDEEEEDEDQEDEEIKVILSVQHLESAFYLLFIGLAISIVAFIGELVYHFYSERQKNRVVYLNPNLAVRYGHIVHLRQRN